MTINRDQFLAGKNRQRTATVETPMGTVSVKALTYTERVTLYEQWLRPDGEELDEDRAENAGLKLITLCAVDENGETFLTEADFQMLRDDFLAMDLAPLLKKCSVLCGLDEADQAESKLLGNLNGLEDTQTDSSS